MMPIAANRPAQQIRDRNTDAHRALPRQAGDRHQPAHALRDLVEARPVGVGPVLAEARNARIDEARIDRGERRVVDAEPLLHVGAVVLHHDVGLRGHLLQHRDAFGRLQVQRDRALVAVQVLEVRTLARAAQPSPEVAKGSAGMIEVTDLVKRHGPIEVLRGVTLSVAPGRGRRDHRPLGQRQEHVPPLPERAGDGSRPAA